MRQQQQEGTEPNKGTVKERKRASPAELPRNEPLTGTLEHRATNHTVSWYRHGGEIQGEEHWEKTGRAKDPATMDASRTAKLIVGLRSTRGEERAS